MSSKDTNDRVRHYKSNPRQAQIDLFLGHLSECGNVAHSARLAGLNRTVLYRYRKKDPNLKKRWDQAAELGVLALEDEALQRAYQGIERPVCMGGKIIMVKKYSDSLLMFLLKGAKPEKYRDHVCPVCRRRNGKRTDQNRSGMFSLDSMIEELSQGLAQ